MNPQADAAAEFIVHPDILKALAAGWSLKIDASDLLRSATLLNATETRMVYEAPTKVGFNWIRIRAALKTNDPVVRFWVWMVTGDITISDPLFNRPLTLVTSTHEPRIEVDLENTDIRLHKVLHGQGRTIQHASCDFSDSTNTIHRPLHPFAITPYTPYFPNQTGGNWPYMGLTFGVDSIDAQDLYAIGGYGGRFQKEDGSWLTEKDMPGLDCPGGSHIHERSSDKGFIRYTNPRATWHDPLFFFQANENDQHSCLHSVVAQKSMADPEDEGLKMLLESYAHIFTRQFAALPRGTYSHTSGEERAQGRILKQGTHVTLALLQQNRELALVVGQRVTERFEIDRRAYRDRGNFFHTWGGTEFYSANEIGIHFWGMWTMHQAIDQLNLGHLAFVHEWMDHASRWLFESFRFWDFQGDRRWAVPYYERRDHSTPSDAPTGSWFAWLGAMQYQPKTPTEIEKHKAIRDLAQSYQERWVR